MEVLGDILTFNVQYIAHQCNCTSTRSAGLAKDIFTKYPYSNVYGKYIRIPGTIHVCSNVINMYAQYNPGPPRSDEEIQTRIVLFKMCLDSIQNIPNLRSIAFPYRIGCGLAKGKWEIYNSMIKDFALRNTSVKVFIVKNQDR